MHMMAAATEAAPAQHHHAVAVSMKCLEDYRSFAALTIQRYYRGWIVRLRKAREEAAQEERQRSTAAQQAEARRQYKAARTIQDAWRSWRNRCIYRFYRDLIKFREAADPRALLRCINAPEAALVEPAAGLHVRFRLGGSSFPPILLYKVFTHRPVTDICAFGPRNYAAEAATRQQAAAGAAHQPAGQQQQQRQQQGSNQHSPGKAGWYCRDDRNGWRPVVELQGHREDFSCGSAGSNDVTGRCRHRHGTVVPRQRRRLRMAAGSRCSSSSSLGTAAAGADAAEQGLDAGYASEPELQGSRTASPPCSSSSRKQPQFYHHSPLVRRAERAQRGKQRRRQWLLKMYRAGMQAAPDTAAGDPQDVSTAVEEPAGCVDGLGSSSQQQAEQATQPQQQGAPCQDCNSEEQLLQQLERQLLQQPQASDSSTGILPQNGLAALAAAVVGADEDAWDIEQLSALGLDAGILAWAQKLDFDSSYQAQWSSTAVTLGSEAVAQQSERAVLQHLCGTCW